MRARMLGKYLKAVGMVCRPGGATIREMAEALDVDIRSAYRIPSTLEDAGVPIVDRTTEGVRRISVEGWYLDLYNRRVGGLPALSLSPEEVAGLCWLKAGERLVGKTRMGREIEAAFGKLDGVLPGETRRHMEKVRRMFLSVPRAPKDYSGKSDILDALVDAPDPEDPAREERIDRD